MGPVGPLKRLGRWPSMTRADAAPEANDTPVIWDYGGVGANA